MAGCSYAVFTTPGALRPNFKAAVAGGRVRIVNGSQQSSEVLNRHDAIWKDFKDKMGATGFLQILPGDPPGMRSLGICGACDDREWALDRAREAHADGTLCFEVRAESSPEEVRATTFVKLTGATGLVVWQERAESFRRAAGAENLQGTVEIVQQLALANNAKLAALLRAAVGPGERAPAK